MLQDYIQHLSNCPKYDVRASEGDKCTCGLDAVMEAYRNHPANSIQLDENPYCGWCGKFKKTPGNGSIVQLCECPEPHPLPESVEEAAKEYMNKANPDTIGSHSLWEAFTAGALWAQKEVFEFVEWAEKNYYFFIESKTWGKTLENEDNLTTSALFSKFREWKQQQLLKS